MAERWLFVGRRVAERDLRQGLAHWMVFSGVGLPVVAAVDR